MPVASRASNAFEARTKGLFISVIRFLRVDSYFVVCRGSVPSEHLGITGALRN